MNKRILFFVVCLCACLATYAQNMVHGQVVDINGDPQELVLVNVKGTTKAVTTDAEGKYSIEAQAGDVLFFSLLGFERQNVKVARSNEVNVVMKEDRAFRLNEVVKTGYSSQERRDLTGSVSTVTLKDDIGFKTVDQMLQGAAPGVFMSNSSGALGGANVLTIRGVSSIMGDNNPLYVIDGVPVYSTDREANSEGSSGGRVPATSMGGSQVGGGSLRNNYDLRYSFEKNPLAALNPDDIESIEILKDAFATAIYGARGAAGVILITTKKGSRGRAKVNVGYTVSLDRPLGKLDLLNGDEYATIYNAYYNTDTYQKKYNTDWLDKVTRTAVSQGVNASVSGGEEKINYFLSMSYDDNQSYIINNDMQRFSARLNLDAKLNDKWKIGMNVSLSRLTNNAMQASDIYSAALKKAPNNPVYDENGDYYYGYAPNPKGDNEAFNPVAQAYVNDATVEDTRVVGNGFLEWKPVNWITLRSEVGTDIYNAVTEVRKGELPEWFTGVPGNQASESTKLNTKMVINNTLNVHKVWGDHFIQGVVGQSYEYSRERMTAVSGSDFFSPELSGIGAAQTKTVSNSYMQESALFSAFARLNYQFKHRYMAGVTYRLDGSSRYNRNNRYLGTPSFSLGWRLSEENFIKENFNFVDELKIRGSLGVSSKDGNNSYYGAQAVYTLNTQSSYGGNNYLQMSQPGNENLDWERTITYDLGLDVELFNSRVQLTLDYYYKKTTNMLFSSNLPYYTGYTKENQNIADMMNQGIDFQLITTNIQTQDFQWQTILNLSKSTNKILKLNFEGNQLDQANSSFKYYEEGSPMGQWYLHKWVGVDPQTGDPLWLYKDGTVSTTPPASDYAASNANKFVMGTALPDVYGSITNTLLYKDFELDFMFTFSLGSRMMNSTRASLLSYSQNGAWNLSKEMLSVWQIPGQHTEIPRLNNSSIIGGVDYTAAITTTRFLENNSYLRLKHITLAYLVPQSLLRKTKFFRQLRLFATLTNVFTLTKYSGLDPEVSAFGSSATAAGYDNMTMPQSRSYQFGVRATF